MSQKSQFEVSRSGLGVMGLSSTGSQPRSAGFLAVLSSSAAFLLAGCSGIDSDMFTSVNFSPSKFGVSASPRVTTSRNVPKGGGRYQVGQPYRVAGRWYEPREQPDLDVVGAASWYGPNFHGRQTANCEVFDQYHLSGAHPTLPLPSYVRVTNVANGQSAIVRINDRGPFSHSRVIDLSRRSAEVLGFIDQGVADVRVQYVGPAPLNGDDTRFLMASINTPTVLEQNGGTQFAYSQVAQAQPADAIGALIGENIATPSMSYAGQAGHMRIEDGADIASVHDLASSASSDLALEMWRSTVEEEGRALRMVLGVFTSHSTASEIARQFALIGAVDEAQITVNGTSATQLTLSYLKPGATSEDAIDLAEQLGLNDVILY
jgi:rare lipoprotein A